MRKILTEVSAGELLDKLSILEIKLNKIKNPTLLQEIKKEYITRTETKNKSRSVYTQNKKRCNRKKIHIHFLKN